MSLLDHNGKPVNSSMFKNASQQKPYQGEAFGAWSGVDISYMSMPGGGTLQFDSSRLTMTDYRLMRENYQINASLSVLNFMIHQMDYSIVGDVPAAIKDHVTENMEKIWTRLVRAMGQAIWAGYSPCVLQWENNEFTNKLDLTKVKDLMPEMCSVNWKKVDGARVTPNSVPQQLLVYDGIKQAGVAGPIPTSNSLWYPLLMENGNMYGRKLLNSAFQPWYFSQLMHVFSNRYYERFGEPVPVGRAPYGTDIRLGNGETMKARTMMAGAIQQLRSGGVVVLPNDRSGNESGTGTDTFDYELEYLESQMRGADFERYMTRLDEEMSLALFTPLLLLRTADVGSYSLGTGHMQMFLWQLNAIAADWAEYINKYIIRPMTLLNFPNAKTLPTIKFRKMGSAQQETVRAILTELMRKGTVGVDLEELGQAAGLSLHEAEVLSNPGTTPDAGVVVDGNPDPKVDTRVVRGTHDTKPASTGTKDKIMQRVGPQVIKSFKTGKFDEGYRPDLGHARMVTDLFYNAGSRDASQDARELLDDAAGLFTGAASAGAEVWGSAESYIAAMDEGLANLIESRLERITA